MHFKNVVIESIAYALPEDIWSSEFIEEQLQDLYQRLHLHIGRLELMTGIRERRHWASNFLPSDASILAGKKVLAKTQLAPQQIDVLIHASVCRNRLEPATASYVHHGLNLPNSTQIFDLSNACLGVLNAIVVGASMIESGTAKSVLIVSGENGRPLLDGTLETLKNDAHLTRQTLKPYFANLTIGSGAVALLLCHQKLINEPKPLILGGVVKTDSSACHLCEGGQGKTAQLSMQTDSEALLKAGISLSKYTWESFKQTMSWDERTAHKIITHQVGKQHQSSLYQALNLDITKDYSTYPWLGNTGSVALPITLCHASEQHVLQDNSPVLLLGIGSGLSSIMMGILWQNF